MDIQTLILYKVFATVFPLVAIVASGYFYARFFKPNMSTVNQLNIGVFTPALIFSVLSADSFEFVIYQNLALGAFFVIILSGALAFPLCRVFNIKPKTFLPPMMFCNSGNLGIPLIVLAFGEAALPAAIVVFLVENLLHFTVGVYILDHKTSFFNLFKIPIIFAMFTGLLWNSSGFQLAAPLHTTIDMLGQISIPLMLFALGVRMLDVDFKQWKVGVFGAALCPLLGVLIALMIQPFLQLDSSQFHYLVLFGALPPAVLNYIVAERYNQEPQQVASIVLLGNMASLLFIPLTLIFLL